MFNLKYKPINNAKVLELLDFTETDGSDPLEVSAFAHNKAHHYKDYQLAKIWVVLNETREVVAFFTTSMTSIGTKIMPAKEQVEQITTKYYPAMLLGQMGVGKKFRGQNMGRTITHFCTGLALNIVKSIEILSILCVSQWSCMRSNLT